MDIKSDITNWVFTIGASQNKSIVDLHLLTLVISFIIASIVTFLLVAILFKFRTGTSDEALPAQVRGNVILEIVWTAIPLLIVTVLGVQTAMVMLEVNPPPARNRHPDVIVNAHQWWWEYRYPGSGVVTANELVLPAGKNLLLEIRSADVVHSFWVIAFGQKMDAIPGHPNTMWIKPTKPGTYLGKCAEFCGNQHSLMRIIAKVVPPEQFDSWLEKQKAPEGAVGSAASQRGKKLFMAATCVECHRVAATEALAEIGPDLTHIAQRTTLGAGVIPNNTENLTRWIMNPQEFKPGVNMPDMRLTYDEARDIATYLESLQ